MNLAKFFFFSSLFPFPFYTGYWYYATWIFSNLHTACAVMYNLVYLKLFGSDRVGFSQNNNIFCYPIAYVFSCCLFVYKMEGKFQMCITPTKVLFDLNFLKKSFLMFSSYFPFFLQPYKSPSLWLSVFDIQLKYILKGLSSTTSNVLPWISFEGTTNKFNIGSNLTPLRKVKSN